MAEEPSVATSSSSLTVGFASSEAMASRAKQTECVRAVPAETQVGGLTFNRQSHLQMGTSLVELAIATDRPWVVVSYFLRTEPREAYKISTATATRRGQQAAATRCKQYKRRLSNVNQCFPSAHASNSSVGVDAGVSSCDSAPYR